MKRVRWECPNGCPAVLGSTRPRRDDVVRFCLACSDRAGRLVPRSAPALERERAHRTERRKEARIAVVERERAQETAYYTVGGVDLREVVAFIYGLPVAREWRERNHRPPVPPALKVTRRTGSRGGPLGRAWPWLHKIMVAVRMSYPDEEEWTPEPPIGTLLHEVAHILVGRDRSGQWHGLKFQECLKRLTAEYEAERGKVTS